MKVENENCFLPGGSPACFANFLSAAAAKLDALVALMALLELIDVMLELGDTWFIGGTVAVVLWILGTGDTMFNGGGFAAVGSPKITGIQTNVRRK